MVEAEEGRPQGRAVTPAPERRGRCGVRDYAFRLLAVAVAVVKLENQRNDADSERSQRKQDSHIVPPASGFKSQLS